jgi:group I intron endonuclease
MPICRAIKKYGFANFSLKILEFCDKHSVLEREQYYMDLLKPKYNLNPKAGSRLGAKDSPVTLAKKRAFRHSVATLAKLRGRRHSQETLVLFKNL